MSEEERKEPESGGTCGTASSTCVLTDHFVPTTSLWIVYLPVIFLLRYLLTKVLHKNCHYYVMLYVACLP